MTQGQRPDGRAADELRPVTFERDYTEMAGGSCLVSFGRTRVLCTASIDDDVPRWMRGSGKGWVTAEYSMLPGSSPERVGREAAKGKQSGRTVEIQRLIGRALRAACDMSVLGERQVIVDCDVLQADGGTRTASICGGYLALHDALARHVQRGVLAAHPLHSFCAAISVGIVGGAEGMVGAAILAGRAALKLGAGRVYVGFLSESAPRLDVQQPELMLRGADDVVALEHLTCLAAGPGLGQSEEARTVLHSALATTQPLVLDADGRKVR